MNFFQAQDQARRTTRWLILLFIVSVISLILLTELLFIAVMYYYHTGEDPGLWNFAAAFDPGFHASIITVVVLVVLLGSLYKTSQLSAGGHVVAELMDAQLVPANSDDPAQRRLLNVVEEMAIASGVPVPPVYIQQRERGINAFAAGLGNDDAIICVTRGTLEALDRNALQGVIAHEFSHILNGDMRMNIRITSILYGILLLGLLGARIMRYASYRRGSRNQGAGIAFVGVGLMAIGFGGSLFGTLIKATANRQREYLADASAVQFTRSTDGICSALKAIGGYSYGSRLLNPNADEISHFFFANGSSTWMQFLFATHPPLQQRILRLDPDWDGRYPKVSTSFTEKTITEELVDGKQETRRHKARLAAAVVLGEGLSQLAPQSAAADQAIHDARSLIAALPVALTSAARDPYHARALVYALLLSSDRRQRERQCRIIAEQAEPGVDSKLQSLYTILTAIGRDRYLPLVSMSLPALKSCSPQQINRFLNVMNRLIRDDNYISLFEWCLVTLITNNVSVNPPRVMAGRAERRGLAQLAIQTRVILSLLARSGEGDMDVRQRQFDSTLQALKLRPAAMYTTKDLRFETVNNALKQLDRLRPLEKQRLLEACLDLSGAGQAPQIEQLDVIRAIAAALHCAIPVSKPAAAGEADTRHDAMA